MNIPRIGWSVVSVMGLLVISGCGSSKEQQSRDAYNRGAAHERKGDFDKAIADYTEAISHNPDIAGAYFSRGLLYARHKGDYDKAIADCNEVIRLDPTLTEAYNNRGNAYYCSGQYDKAWADVETCQRLGGTVDEEFLAELRKASGREK